MFQVFIYFLVANPKKLNEITLTVGTKIGSEFSITAMMTSKCFDVIFMINKGRITMRALEDKSTVLANESR